MHGLSQADIVFLEIFKCDKLKKGEKRDKEKKENKCGLYLLTVAVSD